MLGRITAGLVFAVVAAGCLWAANEQVLYNFSGADGSHSHTALTYHAGALYGATASGGEFNSGAIFKLQQTTSGLVETVLYSFTGGADGNGPFSDLIFDSAGNIYGDTSFGGTGGAGVVYKLTPSGAGYTESVVCSFTGGSDGGLPFQNGKLLVDPSGNLYGTASEGGANNAGLVFELTPSANGWTETVLYNFTGGADGGAPNAALTRLGTSLFGVTYGGGASGNGTVFQLTASKAGWTESVLYSFAAGSDGANPESGVLFDTAGNLYGTTYLGGSPGYGTVYKLAHSLSGWTESVIYSFGGGNDGANPVAFLIFNKAGNLYGTTSGSVSGGAAGYGTIFKLSATQGGWSETVLHSFTGGNDGGKPFASLLLLGSNLYGTTRDGGPNGFGGSGKGVVFRIGQ